MAELSLTINEHEGLLVVDSRLIANRLGIQHESFLKTIRKHRERIERSFGHLRFEIGTVTNSVGATNEVIFALLTEPQATALMTLSRNTDQVIECKLDLVEAFEKAKSIIKTVIPAQNDRLKELEMELAIEKARYANNTFLGSLAAMHGSDVALALTGNRDQVVVSDKPTIEVFTAESEKRFAGQTTKQVADYLEKHYGIRVKSGAEIARALIRAGRGDLITKFQRPVTAEGIAKENLNEVYEILMSGDRQKLIGE
jgi:phage regulator Rha-like protein